MWQQNILGEDTPDKLRSTVLFILGVNLALRAVDEHYNLRRDMPNQKSQLSFENDSKGVRCLVFREDSCSKTYDGGLQQMRKERKVVWIYPSTNVNRCPVRLVDKYLGLCPKNYTKKNNFYLQSLRNTHPKQWYGREVVGQNRVKEVVKELLSSAKIDGYFTNHSLRRTGGSRLFQAGVERKLVKEVTGHRSDAVDCYQITSEEQRAMLSNIIACPSNVKEVKNDSKVEETSVEIEPKRVEVAEVLRECTCKCKEHRESTNSGQPIGSIVSEAVSKYMKEGKTIVKIEIEVQHNA